MTTPADRIRAAREHSGLTMAEVAAAAGLNDDWYHDVEWDATEAADNLSLRQLGVIARRMGLEPLFVLEGEAEPPAPRPLSDLADAVRRESERRGLSAAEVAEWIGWDVPGVQENACGLCDCPARALQDVCERVGSDWRAFVADATAAEHHG